MKKVALENIPLNNLAFVLHYYSLQNNIQQLNRKAWSVALSIPLTCLPTLLICIQSRMDILIHLRSRS